MHECVNKVRSGNDATQKRTVQQLTSVSHHTLDLSVHICETKLVAMTFSTVAAQHDMQTQLYSRTHCHVLGATHSAVLRSCCSCCACRVQAVPLLQTACTLTICSTASAVQNLRAACSYMHLVRYAISSPRLRVAPIGDLLHWRT